MPAVKNLIMVKILLPFWHLLLDTGDYYHYSLHSREILILLACFLSLQRLFSFGVDAVRHGLIGLVIGCTTGIIPLFNIFFAC